MIVYINVVELASKLAHKELVDNLINSSVISSIEEDELYMEDINGNLVYKDEYQDIFIDLYDMYESIILECEEKNGKD